MITALDKLLAEQEGLKGCPFCGGSNIDDLFNKQTLDVYKQCADCTATGALEDAYNKDMPNWQSRPREEKLAKVCQELKGALEYIQNANDGFIEAAASDPWQHIAEVQEKLEKALQRAEQIAGE